MRIAILFKLLKTTAGLPQLLTFLELFVLTQCQPPLKWFILPHKMYKRTLGNVCTAWFKCRAWFKISWNWEDAFIIYQVNILHITWLHLNIYKNYGYQCSVEIIHSNIFYLNCSNVTISKHFATSCLQSYLSLQFFLILVFVLFYFCFGFCFILDV